MSAQLNFFYIAKLTDFQTEILFLKDWSGLEIVEIKFIKYLSLCKYSRNNLTNTLTLKKFKFSNKKKKFSPTKIKYSQI